MAQIHAATKSLASAWNSTDFCQITKFLTWLISVYHRAGKNVNDHCCCPISAVILTTSKLEAILKIYRGSNKLSYGVGREGGRGGGKVKRGERVVGDQMTHLIRSGGEGVEANS